MAGGIPTSVALRSKANNGYLQLNEEGYILFSADGVVSNQYTRFEIERAEGNNQNLVHIRCVFNNKYLSANTETDPWLSAAADKPEEDRSKWNCTLFELRSAGAGLEFRFLHVHLGRFAKFMTLKRFRMVVPLVASPDTNQSFDVFALFDWDTLVIMPRYVSFKGSNDLFLTGQIVESLEHLQFQSPDARNEAAAQEIYMNPDGTIRLRSIHFNKFWRLATDNWILADASRSANATDFWPFKIRPNAISLRCLGNNRFCNRLTSNRRDDCLNAGSTAMSTATELEVTELTVARSIFSTDFRLMDARIYNEQLIVMGTGSASNTTDSEATLEVKMTVTESKSTTWNTSVSLMLGVTTTVVTKVPLIFEGKVETTAELTTTFEFGKTTTTETSFETTFTIVVPPRTNAVVRALATSGTCDVPFSYTQTDVLWNGERETKRLDDGVYTGINAYSVHYDPLFTPMNMDQLYAALADDTAPASNVVAATVAD